MKISTFLKKHPNFYEYLFFHNRGEVDINYFQPTIICHKCKILTEFNTKKVKANLSFKDIMLRSIHSPGCYLGILKFLSNHKYNYENIYTVKDRKITN